MLMNNLFKIILILSSIVYVGLEVLKYDLEAVGLAAFIVFLLAYYYVRTVKNYEKLFLWFLLTNGIAHFLDFLSWYLPLDASDFSLSYYPISILYISSYALLIILLCKTLNLKTTLSQFYITIGVLLALNIFSVTLISETTGAELTQGEYITEFIYSAVVMLLLSVALINYMHKTDNKSMLFLVASICVFFSEMIQLAYIHISDTMALAAFYSITMVLAFGLYYIQSRLEFAEQVDFFSGDKLKA